MKKSTTTAFMHAAIISIACAWSSPCSAQGNDDDAARRLGALQHTWLSVNIDAAPAEDVFNALSRALGMSILGRYVDDRFDHGIRPDLPIFLHVENASALYVLELVLEQCAIAEPCTWQLRDGFVEVGTKERLSTAAANVTQFYPLASLQLESPYFISGGLFADAFRRREIARKFEEHNKKLFELHPYKSAALKSELLNRLDPDHARQELIDGIVELIEPGNWDWGQPMTGSLEAHETGDTPLTDQARRNRLALRKIARLRPFRDGVIISAPPYVHREVDGLPDGPVPAPIGTSALRDRSDAATRDRCTVVVQSVGAIAPGTMRLFAPGHVNQNQSAAGITLDAATPHQLFIALRNARINVDFQATPARQAIASIQQAAGVPIIGRFSDDQFGYGIDPNAPVTLELHDQSARTALEGVLAQCTRDEPCSWQIREGFIEVGTRSRLGVPAARELRLYDISDLMLEVPRKVTDETRHRRELFALDLVERIVNHIEPGAWDWGQIDYSIAVEGDPYYDTPGINAQHMDKPHASKTTSGPSDNAKDSAPTSGGPRSVPHRRFVPTRAVASIRYWRDYIIVIAPDYIHRQLDGYATAPAPEP